MVMESIFSKKPKLVRLCLQKKWNKVRLHLGTKSGQREARGSDTFGNTALGVALINDPPPDIIAALLDIEPTHSLQTDHCGMVPLHYACFKGVSSDVSLMILQHDNGAAARALDRGGNCPLHLLIENICDPKACRKIGDSGDNSNPSNHNSNSRPASSLLSRSEKTTLSNSTSMSMNPTTFNDRLRLVHGLCNTAPEMVRFTNRQGWTPIDVLQEIKAEYSTGPRWERADIVYQILRTVNIQLYRDSKLLSEMKGFQSPMLKSNSSVPSNVSSYGSSISSFGPTTVSQDDRMACSHFGE
jgi:hypothetical protein